MTDIWDWYRERLLFNRIVQALIEEDWDLLQQLEEND